MRLSPFAMLLTWACVTSASAHEFWIEPEVYQVESDAPVVANLKNGEEFEGVALSWFDRNFTRFDMVLADEMRPVTGRLGDTPALSSVGWADGLMVVLHETTPSTLTYTDWDKFMRFADHKDFPNAAADHVANGWSQERFRETYTRHAKSLLSVGSGTGQDRAFGLQTEFIALTNPYAPDFDNEMRVRLEYQGEPRGNAQVEVFEKNPDGAVTISLTRTDADGMAAISVQPGRSYLFDAVVLRPSPDAGTTDRAPVWETLWAALTFAVPSRE